MNTIRARLTAWNAVILSVLFLALGIGALALTRHLLTTHTQDFLLGATSAFGAELRAELGEFESRDAAIAAALVDFQLEGTLTVLFGPAPDRVPLGTTRGPVLQSAPSLEVEQLRQMVLGVDPSRATFLTLPGEDGGFHAVVRPQVVRGDSMLIAVSRSRADLVVALRQALLALVIAAPALLALAALAGYLLAGRSLAPVAAMSRRAAEISATNLHERLPVANARDELGVLAGVINGLLDRVQRAFDQQLRFMADASHELRTPVAILRNESEIALGRDGRTASEYQAALQIVRAEGVRLTRIVNDLFLLARADIGEQPLQVEELYLNELTTDTVRGLRSLADQRQVTVEVVTNGDAPLRGDEDLLRRLLSNLVENAIKHGRQGGHVTVHVGTEPSGYRVEVRDDGPGIPPESRPHVFERFHRVDKARTRGAGTFAVGAGLGLAISRWVAEAHGGTLELVSCETPGATFRLTLPGGASDAASRSPDAQH